VRYEIPIDDDPMIGPEDAPITIVEFSDYECPYCQRWHTEVFEQLLETYPNEVRLVYRDFPLTSIHPNAIPAAIAANCAREQDAFWDYHDKLFGMELGLNTEAYQEYASQLDFDTEEFNECLDSGRYEEEVQADFDFAANLGVRSTPTFFINGIAVVGAQPFEVFQQVIEQELAGEIP
jgi:protein-disulfide isomerase